MAHRGPIRELPAQLLSNQQLQIPRPQLLYHLHFQNKGLKVPLESAVTRNRGGGVPLEFKFARPPVVWRVTRHCSYAFVRLGSVGPCRCPLTTGSHWPPPHIPFRIKRLRTPNVPGICNCRVFNNFQTPAGKEGGVPPRPNPCRRRGANSQL